MRAIETKRGRGMAKEPALTRTGLSMTGSGRKARNQAMEFSRCGTATCMRAIGSMIKSTAREKKAILELALQMELGRTGENMDQLRS